MLGKEKTMQKPPVVTEKMKSCLLIGAILAAYGVYSAGLFLRVGITSDYANLVLEASDILSGNPFLSDWNLTGITFFSTDLFFFTIATALSGTRIAAYYLAVLLMYFTLLGGALLLLKSEEKPLRVRDVLLFLAAGGFPSVYACDVLRAHAPVPAYLFFALALFQRAHKKFAEKKPEAQYACLFGGMLFLTLAWAGDAVALIMGVLPILIVNAVTMLGSSENQRKFNLRRMLFTALAVPLGSLLEALWLNAGKANKNSFLELKNFVSLENLGRQTRLYFSSLLGMYDADFFGRKLLGFATLRSFIKGSLLLFVLYILLRNLVDFIRRRKTDEISVVLSVGFLLMSALFIFTDIAVDATSARYIGYLPVLGGVLIVRFIGTTGLLSSRTTFGRSAKKFTAAGIAAAVMAVSLSPVSFKPVFTPQEGLAQFLLQNGLTSGYAKFWNASHVTLASEEQTHVRAIVYDGTLGMAKFNWFCKNSWYQPEFSNFIVMEDSDSLSGDPFGITKENVRAAIGKPAKVLNYSGYTIYVYNEDITDRIAK